MSFKAAARAFSVPKVTLMYKYKGKVPVVCRLGPAANLSMEEENIIVTWLFHIADRGFPATKLQLLDSVQLLCKNLKRQTNFKNGRPGKNGISRFSNDTQKLAPEFHRIYQVPDHLSPNRR